MNDTLQLEAGEVINGLLAQIAQLSQEKAMLQVQLAAAMKQAEQKGDEPVNDNTV